MTPPARRQKQIQWFSNYCADVCYLWAVQRCHRSAEFCGCQHAARRGVGRRLKMCCPSGSLMYQPSNAAIGLRLPARSFPSTFGGRVFVHLMNAFKSPTCLKIKKSGKSLEDGPVLQAQARKETVLQSKRHQLRLNQTLPYANTIAVTKSDRPRSCREQLLERYKGQAVEPEIVVKSPSAVTQVTRSWSDQNSRQRAPFHRRACGCLICSSMPVTSSQPGKSAINRTRVRLASATLSTGQTCWIASSHNIICVPGDIVAWPTCQRRFAFYGRIARPATSKFRQPRPISPILLADVGGLNDKVSEADPCFVFALRKYSDKFQGTSPAYKPYRFDFSRPERFLAGRTVQSSKAN